MNEYLDRVAAAVEAGNAAPEHTVLLYRAIEEAELQRDVQALESALELTQRIAHQPDGNLHEEGERLAALCADRLDAVRAEAAPVAEPTALNDELCPSCEQPLEGNPVRCRHCGHLFV